MQRPETTMDKSFASNQRRLIADPQDPAAKTLDFISRVRSGDRRVGWPAIKGKDKMHGYRGVPGESKSWCGQELSGKTFDSIQPELIDCQRCRNSAIGKYMDGGSVRQYGAKQIPPEISIRFGWVVRGKSGGRWLYGRPEEIKKETQS